MTINLPFQWLKERYNSIMMMGGLPVAVPPPVPQIIEVKEQLTELELRRLCEQSVSVDIGNVAPLRVFHAVGVDAGFKLCDSNSGRDSRFISSMIEYWVKTGVPIDPDFNIELFNFTISPINYLDHKEPCDGIFSCHLKGRNGTALRNKAAPSQIRNIIKSTEHSSNRYARLRDEFYQIVPRNHSHENWQNRIVESGAKLIATWGGAAEISTQWLMQQGFQGVIDTPKAEFYETTEESCESLYGYKTDIPYKWAGIMAHENFVKDYGFLLNDKTDMGRKISEALQASAALSNVPQQTPGFPTSK